MRNRFGLLPGSNTLKGKLFKLIGPIFLETLLTLTLGVVDTLMLSHHSDDAVAAVGVVIQYNDNRDGRDVRPLFWGEKREELRAGRGHVAVI